MCADRNNMLTRRSQRPTIPPFVFAETATDVVSTAENARQNAASTAKLTVEGHVVGMLHRDIRTTKTHIKRSLQPANYHYYNIHQYSCASKTAAAFAPPPPPPVNITQRAAQTTPAPQLSNSRTPAAVFLQRSADQKHLDVASAAPSAHFHHNLRNTCAPSTTKTYSPRRFLRLGEVLVLGACLLSVLRLPSALSAPLSRNTMDRDAKPKWIDPCSIALSTTTQQLETTYSPTEVMEDNELVNLVLGQAKIALEQAKSFRVDYVKNTFNIEFEAHHVAWKDSHYDWLPSCNKSLGDKTSPEHLSTVQLDSSLVDTFEFLQTFAVGLEQIIWDLEDEEKLEERHPSFLKSFKDAYDNVNALLCEVQVAMVERDVKQRDDVTRAVMTDDFRKTGQLTHRNIRDWIIYRDYMNALEYVTDVFEYIAKGL